MKPSAARWFWRAATVFWCALIFFLSSRADAQVPGFLDYIPYADKFAHAALYAALAAFARLSLREDGEDAPDLRALFLAVAFASLYGATDEFHQRFTPGRTPDFLDWCADTAGAAAAAAVLFFRGLQMKRYKANKAGSTFN